MAFRLQSVLVMQQVPRTLSCLVLLAGDTLALGGSRYRGLEEAGASCVVYAGCERLFPPSFPGTNSIEIFLDLNWDLGIRKDVTECG